MKDIDLFKMEWVEEENIAFKGWDFKHLKGRMTSETLPWDYHKIVMKYLKNEHKLLDMGTGGGEFLLSLNHPYKNIKITEGYLPNIELCFKHLMPLGITVRQIEDDIIPYDDGEFDIIINRHESFDAKEVFRVLKPNGIFITQQVGGENNRILSRILIDDFIPSFKEHHLENNKLLLQNIGFTIIQGDEFFPQVSFTDIGAIVYFAKIIKWEFPGFSVSGCFDKLLNLQRILEGHGSINSREHRFFLVCQK